MDKDVSTMPLPPDAQAQYQSAPLSAENILNWQNMATEKLVNVIAPLANTVKNNSVLNHVPAWDGVNPSKCRGYIKAIDKWRTINAANDEETINAVLTASQGTFADFVQRFKTNVHETHQTWEGLKSAIRENFGSPADAEISLDELSNLRQRKNESIPAYLERAHILSSIAFQDYEHGDGHLAQKLAVHAFAYGLNNENIRRAVLKAGASTLNDAAKAAKNEYEIEQRTNWRSRRNFRMEGDEDDMEVSQMKKPAPCSICGKRNHTAKECYRRAVMAVEKTPVFQPRNSQRVQHQEPKQLPHFPPRQKDIVCWHCGKKGHIRRNCFLNPANQTQAANLKA